VPVNGLFGIAFGYGIGIGPAATGAFVGGVKK